ncbi:hypothetical protein IAE37_000257 [Pseudomonas sp. S31]|nr:hypothetical protein [Pseudomonas sp. S31]
MQTRFVVVPAVPLEKELFPRRIGFPSGPGAGYDLYDTRDKVRVNLNVATRAEAECECTLRNAQQGVSGSSRMGHG